MVGVPGTNLMLPSKPGWLAVHQAAWYGKDTCLRVLLSGSPQAVSHTHTQMVQKLEMENVCSVIV